MQLEKKRSVSVRDQDLPWLHQVLLMLSKDYQDHCVHSRGPGEKKQKQKLFKKRIFYTGSNFRLLKRVLNPSHET